MFNNNQLRKYLDTSRIALCIMICALFISCTARTGYAITVDDEKANMVDERFELLSLVFRLAGNLEYNDTQTEYQQELASKFFKYKEHKAVEYAASLPVHYDAVFKFSVHIVKDGEGFDFIQDIESLVDDDRWTRQSAEEFLVLLNEFYEDTDFASFYRSHISFYEDETQKFIDNTYSDIDLEWFGTYVDPANLRCIYTPSSSMNNYAATVNATIVYCGVSGTGDSIVHEFCHSFANPIAHEWYDNNTEFKEWCDSTIDSVKMPYYNDGKIIAGEYVTRAYTILYEAARGYTPLPLLHRQKEGGFPYIEEVYAMITPYEKLEPNGDIIESILGVKYEMGEEQSYTSDEGIVVKWRVLSLEEPLANIYPQNDIANVFNSETGDVLYAEDPFWGTPCLMIDLGETTYMETIVCRKYCRIRIED